MVYNRFNSLRQECFSRYDVGREGWRLMKAKKLFIFISGMVLLSAAWVGVTSSVKSSQDTAQRESFPAKSNLVQSRWERMANFTALKSRELDKPAQFMFTFNGSDLDLLDSRTSVQLDSDFYLEIRKTYLDAGRKTLFYTIDMGDEGAFLVRSIEAGEEIEIVGFALDSVLNYLGHGLERTDWFLIDAKQRVMASNEKGYVGSPYKIGKSFETFQFKVLNENYTFATLKPLGINLALVNFMGIFGIFMILLAVYIYTGGEGKVAIVEERKRDPISNPGVTAVTKQSSSDSIFEDGGMPEEVRMVDLTSPNTVQEGANLDYADFLIENPVLGEGPGPVIVSAKSNDLLAEVVAKKTEEVLSVTADDWVKLAEDLSANIDKFTKTLEDDKVSEQQKVDV